MDEKRREPPINMRAFPPGFGRAHDSMGSVDHRHISRFVGCAIAPALVVIAPVAPASAEPCPDVEVVFARGTSEAPGLGEVGEAFVEALRSRVGARSLDVYAVNYPASTDFPTAMD